MKHKHITAPCPMVEVHYRGATNTRGSRWIARCAANRAHRVAVCSDPGKDLDENADAAAEALAAKVWPGEVFTFASSRIDGGGRMYCLLRAVAVQQIAEGGDA